MAVLNQIQVPGGTTYDLAGTPAQITGSLTTTWTGSAAPYTQNVTMTGVTANTIGVLAVAATANGDQWNAAAKANLRCTAQTANQITVTAYGTKPTVAIPIVLTWWQA